MTAQIRDAELDRRLARTPIAIVGLAGLFPDSRDLREFWGNIVAGRDCMRDVPEDHWKLADYYDADLSVPDKSYCRRGGFLPEVRFSPLEFGLPPNTLEVTDILQLLSLIVARDVLRDAGADEGTWYDPARTGAIVGVTCSNALIQPLVARLQTPVVKQVVRSCGLSEQDAEQIAEKFVKAYIPWEENSFPGMLANLVAGRIANRFDLGATNCTVDAACASSLAAVKMSVSELLEGRADLMISGGCDAENTIFMYLCFSKTPAFSKSGMIRPFDGAADGTLIGEGIGLLALKRLADAERDGDRIYATIRGIGTASDGRFKSIYAPRAAGQVVCLDRAYADADCSPASVGLVEAHGTGTAVGDATELTALSEVFGEATGDRQYVAVGSVKSQIGHTKAAAGAAGMIKMALALHHKVLPATINYGTPNPAIDLPDTAFYVNTETGPWIRDPRWPRRAAVSAFGFGGTDFHVVMEENTEADGPDEVLQPTARAFLWHAADEAALAALLADGGLDATTDGAVPSGDARIGFAAAPGEEAELLDLARAQLRDQASRAEWSHPRGVFYRRRAAEPAALKTAALFAGQGGQYVGMGRRAVLNVPPLRAAFDQANAQFDGTVPVSRVVYPPPGVGHTEADLEERLRRTEYAQPAICALAAGQFRYLSALGFAPDGVIGHSLGELTALWAAGCIPDEDLFRLARARGRAMAPAEGNGKDSGAMAMIAAPEARVRRLLDGQDEVIVCNHNAPDQFVVGGGTAFVDDLVARCAKEGVKAQRLPVSAAFHTPYVGHAVEAFRPAVDQAAFRPPARPIYANTEGAAYGSDPDAARRVLTEQIVNPVHFAPQVRAMYRDGFRVFVEFGPKRVLSRLVATILADHDDVLVYAMDGGPGRDADAQLKRTAVELAVLGLPVTGIDRYSAAPQAAPAPSKLSIPISGVNIVSEARKAAYRDALADGYVIERPAAAPRPAIAPDVAGTAEPVTPGPVAAEPLVAEPVAAEPLAVEPVAAEARPVRQSPPAPRGSAPADDLVQVARDHLDLHTAYLEGQLRTAGHLTRLSGNGEAAALADAVKEHGLALSRTHTRANEILRDLVSGAPAQAGLPRAAPTRAAPAQAAPEVPVQIPQPLETRAIAPAARPEPIVLAPEPPPEPEAVPASAPEQGVTGVLLEIVADKTGYPADMLELGMEMEADLGIDSIKRVEILGGLKERYPDAATVGPEEMAELRTLDDIVALIEPDAARPAAVPKAPQVDAAVITRDLLAIVADKTGYPADMLELGMEMEADLGIDSIKRVEILGGLKERYPDAATVGPEEMAELRTLDDIVALLAPQLASPAVAVPDAPAEPAPATAAAPPAEVVRLHPRLTALPAVDRQPGAYTPDPIAIIVDDGSPLCASVGAELEKAGWEIAVLRLPGVRPRRYERYRVWDLTSWDEQDLDDAEAALTGVTEVELCLCLATEVPATHAEAIRRLTHSVLLAKHIQQPLVRASRTARSSFVTVTRLDGAFGLRGADDDPAALLGGLQGLVKTLAIETPELFCRALDIAPGVSDETATRLILDELHDVSTGPVEVALDGTGRATVTLSAEPPERAESAQAESAQTESAMPELGRDDLLVVSGGARGVTAECVRALMARTPCDLVLLGRTELGDEPEWAVLARGESGLKAAAADHLRGNGERPKPREVDRLTRDLVARREIRGTLAALSELGVEVDYVAVDVTDRAAVAGALAPYAGRVTGVVHGAGILADRLIAEKTADEIGRVLAAKLDGLANLLAGLDPDALRHLVLFSSVAGFFGNRGQVDYAMANAALNSRALAWKVRHPSCHVTAVNWGAWAGGMVTPQLQALFEQRGVGLIPIGTGAAMFTEQFGRDRAHDVVTVISPPGPLSARPARDPITVPVAIDRDLTELAGERPIADHSLAGRPVLPTTVALGWCVNALERLHPGLTVVEARDFKVFKGITFGDGPAGDFRLLATPQEPYDGTNVKVIVQSSNAPLYGGEFHLAAEDGTGSATIELGELSSGVEDERSPYEDGTLFHGPALRGYRRTLVQDPARLVAEARLDDVLLASGAYAGRRFDPLLSDLMLQAPLVWVRRFRDSACLPVGVGQVRLYAPIPSGTPFLVVVDGIEDHGTTVTCTSTACSADGAVYASLTGVTVVLSRSLDTKFTQRGMSDVRQS
ncbi:SDR family NAD(P)-dependent oxidoreductase [Actinomadura fulvescens]|uniref:Polyketide synthase n=1 Tax=Actinomadura fulvescens TaxID=46160 RepID=A0ABP6C8S0_9ACTN